MAKTNICNLSGGHLGSGRAKPKAAISRRPRLSPRLYQLQRDGSRPLTSGLRRHTRFQIYLSKGPAQSRFFREGLHPCRPFHDPMDAPRLRHSSSHGHHGHYHAPAQGTTPIETLYGDKHARYHDAANSRHGLVQTKQ